jgi:methionyl-tRNA formyltransferase
MRLIYFGSGAFGFPTLEALSRTHEIKAVVTQPDKPAGRGSKLTPTPIAQWASEHLPSVPMFKPAKVREPEMVKTLREIESDAWVVIAFGQKLPADLLADRFAINLHASLLPRWRGAAPINAAILAGDTITGNSVITLAERMDAGQILGTTQRPIEPLMTAGELHDLLSADGPALVQGVLEKFRARTLQPQRQDESLVTIATKLSKSDGEVDFRQKADFVRRQVHALTPWPGVTLNVAITPLQPLKILRVQAFEGVTQEDPGTLIDPALGVLACGHHTRLQLLEVQPPGKKPMPWADYQRGRNIPKFTLFTGTQPELKVPGEKAGPG